MMTLRPFDSANIQSEYRKARYSLCGESLLQNLSRYSFAGVFAGVALLMVLLVSCSKPELVFDEPPGAAGEFCVHAQDCGAGLECFENYCCSQPGCAARCASAAEKLGLPGGQSSGAETSRQCMASCCQKAGINASP